VETMATAMEVPAAMIVVTTTAVIPTAATAKIDAQTERWVRVPEARACIVRRR
jgi:hypothetical protein